MATHKQMAESISQLVTQNQANNNVARPEMKPARPMNEGNPFTIVSFDLSDSRLASGLQVKTQGYGLLYKRDASNLGGRLHVNLGGRIDDLYPGARIRGYFQDPTFFLSSRSALSGPANLLVLGTPDADFIEPIAPPGVEVTSGGALDLLGNSIAGTYTSVAQSTQPSGASPAGSFNANGYSRVRLLIDADPAASGTPATSFDIIPWFQDPVSGRWYEQGSERISFPDSATTHYRYRVATIAVAAAGKVYFEIANLTNVTSLGFIAQGVL